MEVLGAAIGHAIVNLRDRSHPTRCCHRNSASLSSPGTNRVSFLMCFGNDSLGLAASFSDQLLGLFLRKLQYASDLLADLAQRWPGVPS